MRSVPFNVEDNLTVHNTSLFTDLPRTGISTAIRHPQRPQITENFSQDSKNYVSSISRPRHGSWISVLWPRFLGRRCDLERGVATTTARTRRPFSSARTATTRNSKSAILPSLYGLPSAHLSCRSVNPRLPYFYAHSLSHPKLQQPALFQSACSLAYERTYVPRRGECVSSKTGPYA